jgi:cytochrome b561
MSAVPDPERYRLPARMLHWLVAIAIPCQIYLGWTAELADSRDAGSRLIHLHYQLGVIIAVLMVLRATWRITHGAPVALAEEPRWRRRLASLTHWGLYGLLLSLPISGYVIWVWMKAPMDVFGLFEVPRLFTPPEEDETWRAIAWYVHYWSGWALIALTSLHVLAALWHQFVRRDRLILRRML